MATHTETTVPPPAPGLTLPGSHACSLPPALAVNTQVHAHPNTHHKCMHTPHTHSTNMCTHRDTHHTTNVHTCTHAQRSGHLGGHFHREGGLMWVCTRAPFQAVRASAAGIRAPPSRCARQHPLPGQWRQKASTRVAEASFVTFTSVCTKVF